MDIDRLTADPAPAIELGVVLTAPAASEVPGAQLSARHVEVQIVPDGRVVDARVAHLGQGVSRGVFAPPGVGDEVLVLFPGGRSNGAVVLGGLGSVAVPNPTAADGTKIVILHPGGAELRSADGLAAHGIVLGTLLTDLAPYLVALDAFMITTSTATTAPQIAAAAGLFLTAVGAVPPPSTLSANLAASVAAGTPPGEAGPPYATGTHKATT